MNIYKCDCCGREEIVPYGYDLFNEGGWIREWYDKNNEPVRFDYNDTLKKYIPDKKIASEKHFCFHCMYPPIV